MCEDFGLEFPGEPAPELEGCLSQSIQGEGIEEWGAIAAKSPSAQFSGDE
jgi:hypothetical protein